LVDWLQSEHEASVLVGAFSLAHELPHAAAAIVVDAGCLPLGVDAASCASSLSLKPIDAMATNKNAAAIETNRFMILLLKHGVKKPMAARWQHSVAIQPDHYLMHSACQACHTTGYHRATARPVV
jgi:hypothetical protein